MNNLYNNEFVSFNINNNKNNINISGNIKNFPLYKKCIITAPNSVDIISSYTGSYLPFPCEEIALDNTKNYNLLTSENFNVNFSYPNSYYDSDGFTKIISPIIFLLDDKKIIFQLNDLFPLKTLSSRLKDKQYLYGIKETLLPIANSEDTMKSFCYAKYLHNIA